MDPSKTSKTGTAVRVIATCASVLRPDSIILPVLTRASARLGRFVVLRPAELSVGTTPIGTYGQRALAGLVRVGGEGLHKVTKSGMKLFSSMSGMFTRSGGAVQGSQESSSLGEREGEGESDRGPVDVGTGNDSGVWNPGTCLAPLQLVLCCAVLCCAVLCCVVLCCVVLCCVDLC